MPSSRRKRTFLERNVATTLVNISHGRQPKRSVHWANQRGGTLRHVKVFELALVQELHMMADKLWRDIRLTMARLIHLPPEGFIGMLPYIRDPPQHLEGLETFVALARVALFIKLREEELRRKLKPESFAALSVFYQKILQLTPAALNDMYKHSMVTHEGIDYITKYFKAMKAS